MSASLNPAQAENLRRALAAYTGHRSQCRYCERALTHGVSPGQLCRTERELFRVVEFRKEPRAELTGTHWSGATVQRTGDCIR